MHLWLSLTSQLSLKIVLTSAPFNFHSQVTSPPKNMLASALVTFTHKSLCCCLHPIREGSPLWHWFLLWRSHPADTAIRCHTSCCAGCKLWAGFCFHVAQSSFSSELDTAIRCYTSCCAGRPLWAGFGSLRGAIAAQLLLIGATRPVGQDALTGWDQLFPIFLWCKFSAWIIKQVLTIGWYLY